jgi:orotate phosphoribosyltransferase
MFTGRFWRICRRSNTSKCVVGVPRSDLAVATMLALHLNVPLLHLDAFLSGSWDQSYTRWKGRKHSRFEAGNIRGADVLVIDDSAAHGVTTTDIKRRVAQNGLDKLCFIQYMAAFCAPTERPHVDFFLEEVDFPRVLEWNMIHHDNARYFCVDLDGVLCDDPIIDENDDGPKYEEFCLNAKPKFAPTVVLGAIVTARLEKYRPQTEAWLKKHDIHYQRLIMCNLPTGAEQRRLGAHATMKADAYKALGGLLFIESDLGQARAIRAATGREVFWFGHGLME